MTETAASAFDHLPFAALVVEGLSGGDPRVVQANRAFAYRMGVDRAALAGASLQGLLPGTALEALAGEEAAPRTFEASLALGSGPPQQVILTASQISVPERDGCAVVLVEDGRGRPEAERALRESAKRLEDIVDNVNALIYLKAADGTYLWINRAYEQMLQIRREDVQGTDDFALWPQEIAVAYSTNDRAVLEAGSPMEFEEPIPNSEGALGMWLTLKFPLYDEDGAPYAVGGISTDISDRNRAEAMVRSAMEEAERANRAKSEFLSRMSHELRTPLNSIIGFGQLLQMEELSAANADSVEHILRAGRHLLALINEVLEISRIESGVQTMSIEPVHACDPLNEAFELVRPLAAARRIELARDLHGALHRYVRVDYQRLKQVLLNVLMNAVKYNREDGMITVTTEVVENRLRYRVMDTGLGMDPADVERIFTPFERLEISASDIEGTGLGLALSKSLIEAMGGAIGVEQSVKDRGSVFFVDVEVTESSGIDLEYGRPSTEVPLERLPNLPPLTVVYIEDNLANLELVRRILATHGDPTLIPAMQGGLGVELAALHQPDVVLLDLHLPDIDGDEVLRRLRADERTRDIPVLILSADATPSQIERLRAAGATNYVTKPLDIATFVRAVQTAVDSQ